MPPSSILFIHGLFMTCHCWDAWSARFQAKGYATRAFPYPLRDLPVEELRRRHPDPALGRLSLGQVVEAAAQAVRSLDPAPVLVGHSMGGLIVQILLNRGLGAAGVAIDPAPPLGVLTTRWSFLKANWPLLNPLHPASSPIVMSFEQFQYAFVNGQPLVQQKATYAQQVVPESRRVGRGALTGVARLDFSKLHLPLLITAGSSDNIVPNVLNRANYARYRASAGRTDFKEFPGRNHYGIGQPGWEEMADYVESWIGSL